MRAGKTWKLWKLASKQSLLPQSTSGEPNQPQSLPPHPNLTKMDGNHKNDYIMNHESQHL